ncbi:DUF4956 domain-containing protein [Candidatus Pelagibacter sp.]|nr:DUF4956 domain-containing protein [Candidatus Pelagibacter sp.]
MDTLISLAQEDQIIRNITLIQFTFSLLLSLVLNLILAKFYKYFNTSYSSPTSVIETIVLVGIIITLIMVIIGSNIARAFALVGAMSIVRFRNPLKSPKDLVFIFASIAIGMACGTFFYEYAILFLIIFILGNYILKGTKTTKENQNYRIVKVKISLENENFIKSLFTKYKLEEKLINSSSFTMNNNQYLDQVYEINFKDKKNYDEFIKSINSKKIEYNTLLGEADTGI